MARCALLLSLIALAATGCGRAEQSPFERGLHFYSLGEWRRAIDQQTEAIRVDSTNAEAYLVRGQAYVASGDPARAVADYDVVIRLDAESPEAYYQRAIAYELLGDTEQASRDNRTAKQLDPEYRRAFATWNESSRPIVLSSSATSAENHAARQSAANEFSSGRFDDAGSSGSLIVAPGGPSQAESFEEASSQQSTSEAAPGHESVLRSKPWEKTASPLLRPRDDENEQETTENSRTSVYQRYLARYGLESLSRLPTSPNTSNEPSPGAWSLAPRSRSTPGVAPPTTLRPKLGPQAGPQLVPPRSPGPRGAVSPAPRPTRSPFSDPKVRSTGRAGIGVD